MNINFVWLALVVTVVSTIPQILQIIKTKEARDFNTTSIYLAMLSNGLIGFESLRRGYTATLILSLWLISYWGIILSYKLYPPQDIIIRNQEAGEF
jgi:uncharacterized protein with PQ loop repeat